MPAKHSPLKHAHLPQCVGRATPASPRTNRGVPGAPTSQTTKQARGFPTCIIVPLQIDFHTAKQIPASSPPFTFLTGNSAGRLPVRPLPCKRRTRTHGFIFWFTLEDEMILVDSPPFNLNPNWAEPCLGQVPCNLLRLGRPPCAQPPPPPKSPWTSLHCGQANSRSIGAREWMKPWRPQWGKNKDPKSHTGNVCKGFAGPAPSVSPG